MRLGEIANSLSLESLTPGLHAVEAEEVRYAHASESLSELLANAPAGSILITVQADLRILAISVLKGIVAVVFPSGARPEKVVVERAVEEGIPLYVSGESVFTVSGRLYAMGIRGRFGPPFSPFD
jgi:hypothetical protein